jgi:hypothetical protein
VPSLGVLVRACTLGALVRVSSLCVLLAALPAVSCSSGGGLFREYEYEEEMYLSLDGAATIYVNSSIAALNALRGTMFDARPTARVDTQAIRSYYTTPVTRVVRVTTSRRSGRRYVHVRIEVDDVRRLGEAAPFAWSSYQLHQQGELVVFKQQVRTVRTPMPELKLGPTSSGATSSGDPVAEVVDPDAAVVGPVFRPGDAIVAFRIHIPSVVNYHNAGPANLRRGNIVVWEQTLAERLKGTPLELEVRMEPRSILYRTLLLFGAMIAGVAVLFAAVIFWVVRRGRKLKSEI